MPTKIKPIVIGVALIISAVALTATVCAILYGHTVDMLTGELRQRLTAIARTAAVEIAPPDLEQLQQQDDYLKPQWAKVVNQLRAVRLNNEQVLFAYIVRKNRDDPTKIEFVSDSHSLDPFAKIDLNQDGTIDDADLLQWPGQPYPDPPAEIFTAYDHPTTSQQLIYDQWGVEIVGYAPIQDANQQTVAVLAIDMSAKDFVTVTRQTLEPFVLFIMFLVLVIASLVLALVYLWNRQTETLEQLDHQKDLLLSLVGHQLNSPLASLRQNLSDFLSGDFGPLTPEEKQNLSADETTTKGLLDLVNLLLEASRIELGKMRMVKRKQSLDQFFQRLIIFIEQLAAEKKVHFIPRVPLNLPEGTFDDRLTHMTIENLLTNAVKYTPENGTVTLEVRLDGSLLTCTVRDTGMGIPISDQKKLFVKGFRAGNVQNIEGNGLGLFVAKAAIEQQGGTLTFVSEEGKGTTFTLTLPV